MSTFSFCSFSYTILIRFPIVSPRLSPGSMNLQTRQFGPPLKNSNMTSEAYKNIVNHAKEHIVAGDIFQIVLSQRFERRTFADPFEVYRALRTVNPSPYLTYLQVCVFFLVNFFLVWPIFVSLGLQYLVTFIYIHVG